MPADHTATVSGPVLGRRREFLLCRRSQLRLGLWGVALATLLLVPLNVVLHLATLEASARLVDQAPELAASLRSRDLLQAKLVLGGSVLLLLGVFAVGILEGHRTAGAALRIGRLAEEVGRGRFDTRVALRRGDLLHDLANRFNEMAGALAERRERDGGELERIAGAVGRLGPPDAARGLATRIREIAAPPADPGSTSRPANR
jgi:hypothetical protein